MITVAHLGGGGGMPPPGTFENIFFVKNGIWNQYILLESALKMQEMPFQRPKFQNGISNLYILLKMQDMPFQRPKFQKIVSSLWPPPH